MFDTDSHKTGDHDPSLAVQATDDLVPTSAGDQLEPDGFDFDPVEFAEDWEDWLDDDEADEPRVHPQALAEWGEKRALVDAELAPLVTELWRAGIDSFSSCQDLGESLAELGRQLPQMATYVEGRRGRALLDLSPPDAQPFLDMVATSGPAGALYDRMTRWTAVDAWRYSLVMLDLPDEHGTYSFTILAIQVELPRKDIPAVTRGIRRHNARSERDRAGTRRR
jgi:hypothetical protein